MNRSVGSGLATWGISEDVAEPPIGAAEVLGPGVKLGAGVLGDLEDTDTMPIARDWSISLYAESLSTLGIVEPPRVRAEIRYGTGAGEYAYSLEVPLSGLVWHVAAQWVSVRSYVIAPRLISGQSVRVTLSFVPGNPQRMTVCERVRYDAGAIVTARAPQWARAVSVTTVGEVAAIPTTVADGSGEWLYDAPQGGLSVRTPVLPLTLPITVTPNFRNVHSAGVFVPADSNAVRLQPVGAAGWHYLEWEIES